MLVSSPSPEHSYRSSLYESYVTGHQGELLENRSHPALERQAIRHVPTGQDIAILDVGCGQGQLVRSLRALGHQDVTGIDVSSEQIALATKLGTSGIYQADLFEFAPGHPGRYDCIVALDLIEHFDRPHVLPLFEVLRSMLRPGGRLILRTPNGTSPFHGRILFSDITHGTAYTSRSLCQIATATGFDAVATYACRPAGRGAKQLIRRTIWSIVEGLLVVALIAETGVVRGHIVTQNLVGVLVLSG